MRTSIDILALETLTTLRTVIGFLGERDQFAWWSTGFFSATSHTFLAPIFPRLPSLARFTGVTQAAALVHDERIGTGRVYHLFRLPEDLEQSLHRLAQDSAVWPSILPHIADRDTALTFLQRMADPIVTAHRGPVRVGDIHALRRASPWSALAAHYLTALNAGAPAYPYFSDQVS